jgi:hypothetical protein
LFEKLGTLWVKATDVFREKHNYIVYAPRKHLYVALKLKEELSDSMVHRALAHHENNHPTRQSHGVIKPGSFNFRRVNDCVDTDQAISRAKDAGLRYEPLKVVLARHIAAMEKKNAPKPTKRELAEFERILKMFGYTEGTRSKAGTTPKEP